MRQKGFTLIELLVVMAVGSVLLTGAVLSIRQVVWGTDRSNSQVVALTDVNHAAWAIKKDIQMAQDTDLTKGVSQNSTVLSWIDYTSSFGDTDNQTHSCSYVLSGTKLLRTYDGTESIVGRNITSVTFTKDPQDDRVVRVVITATGPRASQRSETLEFSVYMRPEEVQ